MGEAAETRWSRSTRKRGASACSTWSSACAATALACFGILALALAVGGGSSARLLVDPACWRSASPASRSPTASCAPAPTRRSGSPAPGRRCRLLLAASVLVTGGATSPVLVWFALPAVTLGFRFEPRGMVVGTVYMLALFLAARDRSRPRSGLGRSASC